MKHVKHWLTTVAVLLCSMVVNAHDFVQNGIYYNLPRELDFANPMVTVTYMGNYWDDYRNEYRGHVVIPSSVTYRGRTYRVAGIENHAFQDCDALTSIVISNGIESIGLEAFRGCKGLKIITIPKSVQHLGYAAFAACVNLSDVHISSIADWCDNEFGAYVNPVYAFSTYGEFASSSPLFYAKNLYVDGKLVKELVIPNGVTSIESYAFSEFQGVTSISIPESVTAIGYAAFSGCDNLTSVKCPQRFRNLFPNADYSIKVGDFGFEDGSVPCLVKYKGNGGDIVLPENFNGAKYSIGAKVFANSNVTSVKIPNSVTSIEDAAFLECSSLKAITIPESVTHIGTDAFKGCSSLTSITIPNSVTSIGDWAFLNCSNLSTITIPESVTNVGTAAFSGTAWYDNQPDGVVYVGKALYKYKGAMLGTTKVVVKEGTKSIADNAFQDCNKLEFIVIPKSVTHIGKDAFVGCNKLAYATCPQSLRGALPKVEFIVEIGDFRFADSFMASLVKYVGDSRDIVLPQNFNTKSYSIGARAFAKSNIASAVISRGVTSIGWYAFKNCCSLNSVVLSEGLQSIGNGAFMGCKNLMAITIPNSVTEIGDEAFSGCSNLPTVTIPSRVSVIESSAFQGCSSLTSVRIPEGVIRIKSSAFANCSSLNSVVLPEGLQSIGNEAFIGCENLTTITIPNSVTGIGDDAFAKCSNLQVVKIKRSWKPVMREWKAKIFSGCPNLKIKYVK